MKSSKDESLLYENTEEGWRLRLSMEGDIPRLAELERLCFADPWTENMLREEQAHPNALYVLLETSDGVQGYGGMWLWEILGEAHVSNVAVAGEQRRKGYGRWLMLALLTLARNGGIDSMTLEVRDSNLPAQRLYDNLGFVSAGKRPRYYANGEDALIMWNNDIAGTLQKYNSRDEKYAKMYKHMYKTLRGRPEA